MVSLTNGNPEAFYRSVRRQVFPLGSCDICQHPAWLHRLDCGPLLRTAWMCKACKRDIGQMLQGFGRRGEPVA
jgi:hypothetical protein